MESEVAVALQELGLEPDSAKNERPDIDRLVQARSDGCRPCMHAAIFGHWGPPLIQELNAATHCRRCHHSWRSIKEAHCTVCCVQFASNEAASYHWVDGKHLEPGDVKRDKRAGGGPRYASMETEFGPVLNLARYVEYQERRNNT